MPTNTPSRFAKGPGRSGSRSWESRSISASTWGGKKSIDGFSKNHKPTAYGRGLFEALPFL